MKIDLFKLNNFNHVDIDEDITFDDSYLCDNYIRGIKDVHAIGTLDIDYDDEILCSLDVSGVFVLPCAISLEDVEYHFEAKIDEVLGKFEDFYNKNKNTLDILPIIWENIVSEVPIRVVKEGVESVDLNGEGWEFESNKDQAN